VRNIIGGVYYVSGISVKLSLNPKTWYHMHVEVSRTLHALEIDETCHTWICDLMIMCIYVIWCDESLLDDLIGRLFTFDLKNEYAC